MCVGSAGKGEKRLRLRGGDTHARMRKPSLKDKREWDTLRPVRASAADPPDRSPRTVTIRSGGGRAFAAATPAAAGTSMAIAGRGGNDEGAKQDAL